MNTLSSSGDIIAPPANAIASFCWHHALPAGWICLRAADSDTGRPGGSWTRRPGTQKHVLVTNTHWKLSSVSLLSFFSSVNRTPCFLWSDKGGALKLKNRFVIWLKMQTFFPVWTVSTASDCSHVLKGLKRSLINHCHEELLKNTKHQSASLPKTTATVSIQLATENCRTLTKDSPKKTKSLTRLFAVTWPRRRRAGSEKHKRKVLTVLV